jgi:hypothetical protein
MTTQTLPPEAEINGNSTAFSSNLRPTTIQGEIRKIQNKVSPVNDCQYHRIHLKGNDGQHYMTDIVPGFRNYKQWKPLLKVGNVLAGLEILSPGKIDADSKVKLVRPAEENTVQTKFL